MPVEKVGGPLMAVWVGWVMVCFATMTFHTAPLSRNFLGFQEQPDTKMLFGLAPDRLWLAWMHRESRGSLSRMGHPNPFDPRGEFILKYGNRRAGIRQTAHADQTEGQGPGPRGGGVRENGQKRESICLRDDAKFAASPHATSSQPSSNDSALRNAFRGRIDTRGTSSLPLLPARTAFRSSST